MQLANTFTPLQVAFSRCPKLAYIYLSPSPPLPNSHTRRSKRLPVVSHLSEFIMGKCDSDAGARQRATEKCRELLVVLFAQNDCASHVSHLSSYFDKKDGKIVELHSAPKFDIESIDNVLELLEPIKKKFNMLPYAAFYELAIFVANEFLADPEISLNLRKQDNDKLPVEGCLSNATKELTVEKGNPTFNKEYLKAKEKCMRKLRGLIVEEEFAVLLLCHLSAFDPVCMGIYPLGRLEVNPDPFDIVCAFSCLDPIKKEFPILSPSYINQLAGVVALERMQECEIPFHPARQDNDKLPVEGRLSDATKELTMEKCHPTFNEECQKATEKCMRKLRGLIVEKEFAIFLLRNLSAFDPACMAIYPLGSLEVSLDPVDTVCAFSCLDPIKEEFTILSSSCINQLAGIVALERMHEYEIPFHPARQDKNEPPLKGHLPDDTKGFNPMGNGKVKHIVAHSGGLALDNEIFGFEGPSSSSLSDHLRDVFANHLGLTESETVAILSGLKGRFGFEAPSSSNTCKLDKSFFNDLLRREKDGLPLLPWEGALLSDPVFRFFVEKYAKDEDAFLTDYAKAHKKLGLPRQKGLRSFIGRIKWMKVLSVLTMLGISLTGNFVDF